MYIELCLIYLWHGQAHIAYVHGKNVRGLERCWLLPTYLPFFG
jgi:hypothetical protein